MGDLNKKDEYRMPSQKTIDKNSTKGTMGEGKVDTVGAIGRGAKAAVNAGKQLYDSVKNAVVDSMAKTIEVKESNKERVRTITQPKPGANPSEVLRKKK